MNEINFANPEEYLYPEYLYLLLLLIPVIAWYILRLHSASASMKVSTQLPFANAPKTFIYYFRHALFVLRVMALSLLIVILARPQSTDSWKKVTTEGIDIIIALDISSSMLSKDFEPNRLEASKAVATEFISGRPYDRIGLVVFSGESFTQCPLTTDHAVLINLFKDIRSGMIEDGTAIGMGLATAVNRLKESKSKSKIVILLTDGENNRGEIAPMTAAELAKTFGIRVYTIGVGTKGQALSPVGIYPNGAYAYDMVDVSIDEDLLTQIGAMNDGKYFRATNKDKLKSIYAEIDQLEKSKIDEQEFSRTQEEYLAFASLAGIILLLEILLKNTWLRSIP